MNIIQKLEAITAKNNSLVCVGLDSALEKIPSHLQHEQYPQFSFNKAIIDKTAAYVCAYKPNIAFYEARGEQGLKELKMTMDYLHSNYPDLVTICDAKRADIGNTNNGYVQFIFDYLGFDAVTLHPYLGSEALAPFLERTDKASIILCRTSNPGAGELQDLITDGKPLYMYVAEMVAKKWNKYGNCMLVVGATYPNEMSQIRTSVGDMTFLIPGVGAQGADLQKAVTAGRNSDGTGMIITASRSIIFASHDTNFATQAGREAEKLRNAINLYRTS